MKNFRFKDPAHKTLKVRDGVLRTWMEVEECCQNPCEETSSEKCGEQLALPVEVWFETDTLMIRAVGEKFCVNCNQAKADEFSHGEGDIKALIKTYKGEDVAFELNDLIEKLTEYRNDLGWVKEPIDV